MRGVDKAHLKKPFCQHHQTNGCAGFRVATAFICSLGEKVIDTEALPLLYGTDTPGLIHFLLNHILPKLFDSRKVIWLRLNANDIGYCGQKIHRTHRVATDCLLLKNRLVRLLIPGGEQC